MHCSIDLHHCSSNQTCPTCQHLPAAGKQSSKALALNTGSHAGGWWFRPCSVTGDMHDTTDITQSGEIRCATWLHHPCADGCVLRRRPPRAISHRLPGVLTDFVWWQGPSMGILPHGSVKSWSGSLPVDFFACQSGAYTLHCKLVR